MKRLKAERLQSTRIKDLADDYIKENKFSREEYIKYGVKRGLRNEDGTGVIAGLTKICRVHGYMVEDGEKIPDHGRLIYRGIDVNEIVEGSMKTKASSFEETIWLLIFGHLPNDREYELLQEILGTSRDLPEFFIEDIFMKHPSKDIMNQLSRGILSMYSYDDSPDDLSLENNIRQSLALIASLPTIMSAAYQVKRRYFDKKTMYFHQLNENDSTAQAILRSVRPRQDFTEEEVNLLDMCLALHAEHGGGNNSTFTTRVLSSSDTDIYSTISAAIGSLKGFKHGGANFKVREMMAYIMEDVKNWDNDDEIIACLEKIVRKEGGDKSGLIYGMGHAIYTLSDPRA
ncbi:MAG: citrate synthase, partial [Clostridia bacterium]